jgi:C-terminal processing protease CtpA/Prc
VLIIINSFFISCEKEKDEKTQNDEANEELYAIMKNVYYWYEHVPTLDPTNYSDPYSLMDALKYDKIDRWSFVMTQTEYNQEFVESEDVGHGFTVTYDADNKFKVLFVYPKSPAAQKGIKRGWIIQKIDGTDLTMNNYSSLLYSDKTTQSFTFLDKNDSTHKITSSKETFEKSSVFYTDIIEQNGKKIGYIILMSFVEPTEAGLDSAFSSFTSAGGIDDFILDVRYNGGGMVDVATYLASSINQSVTQGEVFMKYEYNDIYQDFDTNYLFTTTNHSLGIDRIFVIATEFSASASELIINGLDPFLNVIQIGNTTHGKPVGMAGIDHAPYVFFPVVINIKNANNEGDYFDGLIPNVYVKDDLSYQLGDTNELCLNEALHYIKYGAYSKSAKFGISQKRKIFRQPAEESLIIKTKK